MITHYHTGGGDIVKQGMPVVKYIAGFAVHGVGYLYQFATKEHDQRLVAQAYTQYGYFVVEIADGIHGYACLKWSFRAGGYDEAFRVDVLKFFNGQFIVS